MAHAFHAFIIRHFIMHEASCIGASLYHTVLGRPRHIIKRQCQNSSIQFDAILMPVSFNERRKMNSFLFWLFGVHSHLVRSPRRRCLAFRSCACGCVSLRGTHHCRSSTTAPIFKACVDNILDDVRAGARKQFVPLGREQTHARSVASRQCTLARTEPTDRARTE